MVIDLLYSVHISREINSNSMWTLHYYTTDNERILETVVVIDTVQVVVLTVQDSRSNLTFLI